jgi:hypothetical protein
MQYCYSSTAIHPSGHKFHGVPPPPVSNLMAADMAIRRMSKYCRVIETVTTNSIATRESDLEATVPTDPPDRLSLYPGKSK